MTPERLLTAFDRFTLQLQMRDVEPREDDTWLVINTKTADPETDWPGELVSEHPTHAEARIGLMKAILADVERNPCRDSAYRDALLRCAERYRDMLVSVEGRADAELLAFVAEFGAQCRAGYPVPKLCRWLGYIQRGVIEKGLTTVTAERDWTRPLFRPLDFPEPNAPRVPEDHPMLGGSLSAG